MTHPNSGIALCSSVGLATPQGKVPEWVHLLPAGEIRAMDGRGPYRVASMTRIALQLPPGDKLPIDECHATDLAARMGLPAPARGWIVELQAREDGLWGRVEWTATGRQLMAERAYKGISPAIVYNASRDVLKVLRASLTNTPNLQGLTALHSASIPDGFSHAVRVAGVTAPTDAKPSVDETDLHIMKVFGMSQAEYLAALKAEEAKSKATGAGQ